jgi:hypothetical protein
MEPATGYKGPGSAGRVEACKEANAHPTVKQAPADPLGCPVGDIFGIRRSTPL